MHSSLLQDRLAEALTFDGQVPDMEYLNRVFEPLGYPERIHLLYAYFKKEEVLVTSSFGASSAFLLYQIHQLQPRQQVYFINTTYHFPETLAYKEQLAELLDLDVVEILPDSAQNELTREGAWWKDHPRMCCSINKVVPLEPIKAAHKVWVSGLMAYQTDFRSRLRVFEQQGDILKFHPLIDLEEGQFLFDFGRLQLPKHPLESQGYGSVGCIHCTEKGEGRTGRWKDKNKTECGLHPGFFNRKNA